MTPKTTSLIHDYRQDRRNREIPNFVREDLGSVVRYTPTVGVAEGIVCFTNMPDGEVDAQIRQHVAHFERLGIGFEWKVYESDQPAALRARLVDAGFEEGEPEALMVQQVDRFRSAERRTPDGLTFSRVTDVAMLEQIAAVQEAKGFEWMDSTWPMSWHASPTTT